MEVSVFENQRDSILRREYMERSLREERRNTVRLETYGYSSQTGGYVHNIHGMVWPQGSRALSHNVIRYIDERTGQMQTEDGAHIVTGDEISIRVWRPENSLTIVELTSRAMGDVKKGNVVVMSADLDTSKLERIAKCLKAGVHCYIMDMATEKIEKILREVDLGVVLFLDENIRMDAGKCERIVESCQQKIVERSGAGDYTEDLALEELFAGVSLHELAFDNIVQTGNKRPRKDEDGPDLVRQRIGTWPLG